jgi:hypothetical protein
VNGEAPDTIPPTLDSAQFQVQQVLLRNQGDALAKRMDMTQNALSYPCEFVQQELVIPVANSASSQQVTATGFRSGEVKSIQLWLTRDSDEAGTVKNPLKWYAPEDFQMLYAGEVYARFDKKSNRLWNLVNNRLTPYVSNSQLAFGGGAYTSTAYNSEWLEAPFGQTFDPVTAHSMYVAGMPITNGIVNFQFKTPTAQADWKLHVSYIYNAVAVFSQGTVELVM